MNTAQISSSNPDKQRSYPKTQKPDARNKPEGLADKTANQADNVKKQDQATKTKRSMPLKDPGKNPEKDKLEVNEYLKTLSRLENKLNLEEITDEDLEKITTSLEERILALTDVQQNRLRQMEFFKQHGIDNINELKQTLLEMFEDIDQRGELFELLKSPEFMSILLNESDKPIAYPAPVNNNLNAASPAQV
jgi:hypothetical protein